MVACSMLLPGGDVRQAQHAALPSTFSNAELIQPGQGAGGTKSQGQQLPAYNRKAQLQRLGEVGRALWYSPQSP